MNEICNRYTEELFMAQIFMDSKIGNIVSDGIGRWSTLLPPYFFFTILEVKKEYILEKKRYIYILEPLEGIEDFGN